MNALIPEHRPMQKIARLARLMTVTEKIDGTNGVIYVGDNGVVAAGSKNRWLTTIRKNEDNFGFCRWVMDHADEVLKLGPGYHHGEWWGHGIQRGYGLPEGVRRFSLFHPKWQDDAIRPLCMDAVPILVQSVPFSLDVIEVLLVVLKEHGSVAVPGYLNPEGVVIYHEASKALFKKTIHGDESPKGPHAE
jgi:hypothetical protein